MKRRMNFPGVALSMILVIPASLAAYDNGATNWQVVPEVIWATAVGGGTWVTEVQIVGLTLSSQVSVYFFYGEGGYRGPFHLWTSGEPGASSKFNNILKNIQDWFDPGFNYYNRVGAMWFFTQDADHRIHVTARTVNGNYSKTFPGLNGYDSNTAAKKREMMITNLAQHSQYRSTVGFHNPTSEPITVGFLLVASDASTIGSIFYKTFVAYDFQAFYPFTEAGVPSGSYDNVWLLITPISETGKIYCFGATANNYTNDPASHIAVHTY